MAKAFIHETACVGPKAEIGEDTKIWHFSHVENYVVIGKNCVLGQNTYVASMASIGDGVKIQNNVSLYDRVILKDDVFIGPSVVFTNVLNPRAFVSRKNEYKETIVEKGATIGANATVVCGNTIGAYAMVGAGTVITKDVPAHALVYGNPSRVRGWVCKCGNKIDKINKGVVCPLCKSKDKEL